MGEVATRMMIILPTIAVFSLVLKKGFDVPHIFSLPIATYVVTGSHAIALTTAAVMLIDSSLSDAEQKCRFFSCTK